MPKLPRVPSLKLIRALQRAGFVVDHISGSHYIMFSKKIDHPITVPFHNKTLKPGTLHAILKSAKISVQQLIDLL